MPAACLLKRQTLPISIRTEISWLRSMYVVGWSSEELVRVLESDSGTAFIEKVLTVIRTSATELEAMKKICGDYTLCPDTADYILALRIDELTSLSLQKCQEALSYFEVMSSSVYV